MAYIAIFTVLSFSVFLRGVPHRLAPHGVGVDHWYWKAYIREYKKHGVFPPVLSQYVLDEQQWYPPVFPLLISTLPAWFFDKYDYVLAVIIDLLRMLLLLVVIWVSTQSVEALLVAGVLYAIAPILVSYNVQLNPRGLAALFLDGIGLVFLLAYPGDFSVWQVVLVGVLSGAILLTHKMTTQLFWFLAIAGFCITGDWVFISLIPLSVLSALILSGGFYARVARAHWDIVSFWNRNWRWLSAHPLRESPVYGSGDYVSRGKFHRGGASGLLRRSQFVFGFGPASWLALAMAGYLHLMGVHEDETSVFLLAWLMVILVFVVLTTEIPLMKCLGNGYLYLYNAIFPTAMIWGLWSGIGKENSMIQFGFLLAVTLCIMALLRYFSELKASQTLKVDDNLARALECLKGKPAGLVMCLPLHWSEVVAYKTGKDVLWGAHGYGFRRIEPIFPRLMMPIRDVIRKYGVQYLLVSRDYLPRAFLDDLPASSTENFGDVYLYSLDCRRTKPRQLYSGKVNV